MKHYGKPSERVSYVVPAIPIPLLTIGSRKHEAEMVKAQGWCAIGCLHYWHRRPLVQRSDGNLYNLS